MNSLKELIIAQKENEELKKQIEAFKNNCDAMKDVIEQMKNCDNCNHYKYDAESNHYCDLKGCMNNEWWKLRE